MTEPGLLQTPNAKAIGRAEYLSAVGLSEHHQIPGRRLMGSGGAPVILREALRYRRTVLFVLKLVIALIAIACSPLRHFDEVCDAITRAPSSDRICNLVDDDPDPGEILDQAEWCIDVAAALRGDSHHGEVNAGPGKGIALV